VMANSDKQQSWKRQGGSLLQSNKQYR